MDSVSPKVSATPLRLIRPSWADPGWALLANDVTNTDVTLVAGTPTPIMVSSSLRWAFKIFYPETGAVQVKIMPFASGSLYGWNMGGPATPLEKNIFTDGPVVCGAWFALCAAGITLRIQETKVQVGIPNVSQVHDGS